MTRRMRPIEAALVLHVQTPVSGRRAKAVSLLAVCITTCQRLSVPHLGTLDTGSLLGDASAVHAARV